MSWTAIGSSSRILCSNRRGSPTMKAIKTAACRNAEKRKLPRSGIASTLPRIVAFRLFGHERNLAEAGSVDETHHLQHAAVIGVAIAAHIDARGRIVVGDGLQPRHDLIVADLGILQIGLALR